MRTHVPDFWNDRDKAELQMKKIKDLKYWIDGYNEVAAAVEELQLAYEFLKEGIVEEADVDKAYARAIDLVSELELRNMLRREEDKMDAVIKINSGSTRRAYSNCSARLAPYSTAFSRVSYPFDV